ncbi:MAG TPA: beta-galactosidase GalB [Candidatus Sulfotelmatobacter sp.]|nr:beta-galactosidase GalB [Candidatus Sulfotelmatobacter sp.]
MKQILATFGLLVSLIFGGTMAYSAQRTSFDDDWRFIKGDPADAYNKLFYSVIENWVMASGSEFTRDPALAVNRPKGNPCNPFSYIQSGFDDSHWRSLNLPHDWGIEGPFSFAYPGNTGRLPWAGVGWYRKHFQVPGADSGKRIYLDVDGAMAYATVWLNDQFVGGWPYGYSSWRMDLTPYIKFGGENVIAIRLDNPPDSSRWYPGGGIYRNVWLVKAAPIHVGHWGVYVTTPEVSKVAAKVKIQVNVDNNTDSDAAVSVKNEIYELKANDEKGRAVASIQTDGLRLAAGLSNSLTSQIQFAHPKLWDLETRARYAVVTSVIQDGKTVDQCETPFGIRTIEFTATNGFLLNGKRVQINGVCDHHDLGAIGTAVNVRALQRQIEILQQMGCNAIRTSHNPPAPELLDLCDKMGMLVMDESFDCWEKEKTPNDYHLLFDDWHEKDWRAELRRDRNHPSIILWSIGNEIAEQMTPGGQQIAAELTGIAHEEDPTRPTTAACNHGEAGFNGFQNNVDVFGYNYRPSQYAEFRQANPNKPLFGSETASCISSRGVYYFPVTNDKAGGMANYQVSSYDLYAPHWAMPPDTEFAGEDKNPFVAGEFVWTGFDYLGEPTPYYGDHVPSRSSYFGIIDLAGFPKDRFYLYQAHWRPDFRMAHIVPQCWNWPGREGQITPVHVYTSGDEAELFLNGKSLGRKKKGQYEYRLRWDDVAYEPGELKVVAYKNGRRWATDTMETTGPAAKLLLTADRRKIDADGKDLSYITVKVADSKGRVVAQADNQVHFDISGPGELIATDNGDATDLTSFQSPQRNAFNGLVLAIVRSKASERGTITLRAESPDLTGAIVVVRAE